VIRTPADFYKRNMSLYAFLRISLCSAAARLVIDWIFFHAFLRVTHDAVLWVWVVVPVAVRSSGLGIQWRLSSEQCCTIRHLVDGSRMSLSCTVMVTVVLRDSTVTGEWIFHTRRTHTSMSLYRAVLRDSVWNGLFYSLCA
jgi:hypothetical protein